MVSLVCGYCIASRSSRLTGERFGTAPSRVPCDSSQRYSWSDCRVYGTHIAALSSRAHGGFGSNFRIREKEKLNVRLVASQK